MQLNPEKIITYISAAEGSYDVGSTIPRGPESSQEIMTWLLDSIACSLMAIARILAYKDSHGDN